MIEFHEMYFNPAHVSAVGSPFHPPATPGTTQTFSIYVVGASEPFQFRYPDRATAEAARADFMARLRAAQ